MKEVYLSTSVASHDDNTMRMPATYWHRGYLPFFKPRRFTF